VAFVLAAISAAAGLYRMLCGGQHFDQALMNGPKKRFHNFDLMEKGLEDDRENSNEDKRLDRALAVRNPLIELYVDERMRVLMSYPNVVLPGVPSLCVATCRFQSCGLHNMGIGRSGAL
jgi:hypothetical protein